MGVELDSYTSMIDGCRVNYEGSQSLQPDAITDAVALIAAKDANRGDTTHLRVVELGCGAAPFLTLLAARLRQEISVDFIALDLSEDALKIAASNLERVVRGRRNPGDNITLLHKSWTDLELEIQGSNVAYFNPPYLPRGEEVRDKWKSAPDMAMYVDGSDDGLDHYRWFIPQIGRFMAPDASTFIRTPRDFGRFTTITDIVHDHHDPESVRQIFVQASQDSREGKAIAVSPSLAGESGPLMVEVGDMRTRIFSSMLSFQNSKTASA